MPESPLVGQSGREARFRLAYPVRLISPLPTAQSPLLLQIGLQMGDYGDEDTVVRRW